MPLSRKKVSALKKLAAAGRKSHEGALAWTSQDPVGQWWAGAATGHQALVFRVDGPEDAPGFADVPWARDELGRKQRRAYEVEEAADRANRAIADGERVSAAAARDEMKERLGQVSLLLRDVGTERAKVSGLRNDRETYERVKRVSDRMWEWNRGAVEVDAGIAALRKREIYSGDRFGRKRRAPPKKSLKAIELRIDWNPDRKTPPRRIADVPEEQLRQFLANAEAAYPSHRRNALARILRVELGRRGCSTCGETPSPFESVSHLGYVIADRSPDGFAIYWPAGGFARMEPTLQKARAFVERDHALAQSRRES